LVLNTLDSFMPANAPNVKVFLWDISTAAPSSILPLAAGLAHRHPG
jgi:hypothetical protein